MAQFKFGMFYFRDKSIRVESTDIVTSQYGEQLIQVLARPDLSSEDGWIEVYWANRKEPRKKVAAKLLLLGGLCSHKFLTDMEIRSVSFLLKECSFYTGQTERAGRKLFTLST